MRFHVTLAHSQVHQAWKDAYAAYDAFAEAGDEGETFGGTAMADTASRIEHEMVDAIMAHKSVTPTELRKKIAFMRERGPLSPDNLCWDIEEVLDGIERDLKRMQGWPVSEGVLMAWTEWRRLADKFTSGSQMDGVAEQVLSRQQDDAYERLVRADCVTPGDFILKQYARLLTTCGSTNYGSARANMTGNWWDVDVDGVPGGCTHDVLDAVTTYDDIDATDVGANLLAYGLPYFDAKAWMERAAAVGQGVSLVQQQHGGWSFGVHLVYPEEGEGKEPPLRIRRERDRLLRILNFQGGAERYSAISDELRCNWSGLVYPLPAQVLS